MSADVIRFEVPLPPPGLRRNSETRNAGYRSTLKRAYQELVWCAGRESTFMRADYDFKRAPFEKAHVHLTWRHAGVGPDRDNAIAACKSLIDVLKATGPRPLAIIRDDSPDCMTLTLDTEKVKTRKEEAVLVEVTRA